ncbi:MAG: hypothetical protein K2I23_06830 [Clostridia bacterium]|nr:hypothetical protein [Clostridia bacterium]
MSENSQKLGFVIGIGGFFLLVADLITATVLLINGIYVGAIVCAAIFVGLLATAFIAAAIDHAKVTKDDIRYAKKITEGEVIRCIMTSMSAAKSTGQYMVEVSADGAEYVASSAQSYEAGEKILVGVMSKKRAIIVDESDLEKLNKPKIATVSMHRRHHPRHRH